MAHFPARGRSLLASLLIAVTIFGALASALPRVRASASPAWTVSLDANSISGTDVMLDASAMQGKSFRVGAVINASNSAPLKGVYGWQFEIEYNSSAFIPQGDPGGTSYPDGAQNTVLFGSQTTVGTVNWAGRINANGAFASYIILPEFTSGLAKIVVVWVLLAPSSSLTISAKTLLANVGFELLDKPGSPQAFKIGGVKFVDNDAFGIPNVIAGLSVTETVTNDPPRARFSVTRAGKLGQFAFLFDASRSSDAEGPIPNPPGYFWDFGDGTQDLGVSGSRMIHNFGTNGTFTVSLRVQDSQGATGSVRDATGGLVRNFQPSHTRRTIPYNMDVPPVAVITGGFPLSLFDRIASGLVYQGPCFDCSPLSRESIFFDGERSYDPDGAVLVWYWNFGDGTKTSDTSYYGIHTYSKPGNYSVVLTVVDDANLTASVSEIISLNAPAFTFIPTIPTVGENVSFDGTHTSSSLARQYGNSVWSWDFGDGSSASGPIVSHIYGGPGTYRINMNYTVLVTAYTPMSTFQYKMTLYGSGRLQVRATTTNHCQQRHSIVLERRLCLLS